MLVWANCASNSLIRDSKRIFGPEIAVNFVMRPIGSSISEPYLMRSVNTSFSDTTSLTFVKSDESSSWKPAKRLRCEKPNQMSKSINNSPDKNLTLFRAARCTTLASRWSWAARRAAECCQRASASRKKSFPLRKKSGDDYIQALLCTLRCPTWNLQILRLVRRDTRVTRVGFVGVELGDVLHRRSLNDRVVRRVSLIIRHRLEYRRCRWVFCGRIRISQHQLQPTNRIAIMMIAVVESFFLHQSTWWWLILHDWIGWCLRQFAPVNVLVVAWGDKSENYVTKNSPKSELLGGFDECSR